MTYIISRPIKILRCFFFQAEDGIRDYKVTGVQTCALPISPAGAFAPAAFPVGLAAGLRRETGAAAEAAAAPVGRSEERRVGKEGTARVGLKEGRNRRVERRDEVWREMKEGKRSKSRKRNTG